MTARRYTLSRARWWRRVALAVALEEVAIVGGSWLWNRLDRRHHRREDA